MQQKGRCGNVVLLVIDTQKLITNENLYCFETFTANVKALIKEARENGVEVVFVRHDDGPGKPLTRGTEGFEIYDGFQPAEGELIFDKTVNSSFCGTGLLEYLKEKGETQIMAIGLQTDYCMDATIKAGFEHGFRMIVPAYANSTFDNQYLSAEQTYRYYNEFMWNRRYAECIPLSEALQRITGKTAE